MKIFHARASDPEKYLGTFGNLGSGLWLSEADIIKLMNSHTGLLELLYEEKSLNLAFMFKIQGVITWGNSFFTIFYVQKL